MASHTYDADYEYQVGDFIEYRFITWVDWRRGRVIEHLGRQLNTVERNETYVVQDIEEGALLTLRNNNIRMPYQPPHLLKEMAANMAKAIEIAKADAKIPVPRPEPMLPLLPTDSDARKGIPMATGCLDYFPGALAAVAQLSKVGNDKHNPGEPLHWAREKSGDHADTILRHLAERGTVDTDGVRHSVKVAWRALALLQIELERANETGVAVTPRPL